MTYTNKLNLPQPLVDAVVCYRGQRAESVRRSDISVTQLIGPPQIRKLSGEHAGEMTVDVSDEIWALMGTHFHETLSTRPLTEALHNPRDYMLLENRLFMDVRLPDSDKTIVLSGQPDLIRHNAETNTIHIEDYKFTSVWTTMNGVKDEWVKQLNLYKCMIRAEKGFDAFFDTEANGEPKFKLSIITIYRDWSVTKSKFEENYPSRQVRVWPVKLWTEDITNAYIRRQIQDHFGEDVRECTDEERWYNGGKVAVMKKGQKRAVKLFDENERELAQGWLNGHRDASKMYLVHRPGVYKRCEDYCRVADFCKQWNGGKR